MMRNNGKVQGFELESLKNLGPVSSRQLQAVGIETIEQLETMGPFQAFQLVANQFPSETSVTFLYALHGALLDIPLGEMSDQDKARLRDQARG